MAGHVNKGKNLQNQQDLDQQTKARSQNAQSAEFSSSIPETDEADIEFIPSKQLEEQVEES